MKVLGLTVLAVALSANLAFGGNGLELKDKKEKVSYGIGMSFGTNLGANIKKDAIEVDVDLILRGMKDGLTGAPTALDEAQLKEVLTGLQEEVNKRNAEREKAAIETNKKAGEEFMAANKTKEGVITLPSGLQYKVIKEGDGAIPKATDLVETNYRGALIDNTEFDSSYKRGQAAVFPVNGVIPGWVEALQKMKVGSKWQLFVPPELGYGAKGAGNLIGPNATLIFDIELLAIREASKGGGAMGGMGGAHGH
jgi:FKBP-type peptidyl-prolyl cis-trans isomerase FklB